MSGRFLQEDPISHVNLFNYGNNNPLIYSDPYGLDAIVLNDTDGALGAGHNGIAIGDDLNGWHYYSHDGPSEGTVMGQRFETASGIVNANRGRYEGFYRIPASPAEDRLMRESARQSLSREYNASPFSKERHHCGDVVDDTLKAGGIPIGQRSFPYFPNKYFESTLRANPAGQRRR